MDEREGEGEVKCFRITFAPNVLKYVEDSLPR